MQVQQSEVSQEMNKTMLAILKTLDGHSDIVGSREIAKQLQLHGIDLTERTVRYHLKIMDERGYTEVFGKKGARLQRRGKKSSVIALYPRKSALSSARSRLFPISLN